jgi:WD40 repeat protein
VEDFARVQKDRKEGGEAPVARLWAREGGELEKRKEVRMESGPEPVYGNGAALAPDGKLLALYSQRTVVELWDLGGKEPRRRALIDDSARLGWGSFGPLVFSPDGRFLITTGVEGRDTRRRFFKGLAVRIWDVRGERPVESKTLEEADWDGVYHVALSPDGKLLAVQGGKDRVVVWRLDRGEKLWSKILPGYCVPRFAPDSRHLILGNGNGTLYVLRLLPPANGRP